MSKHVHNFIFKEKRLMAYIYKCKCGALAGYPTPFSFGIFDVITDLVLKKSEKEKPLRTEKKKTKT